ncbi:MAG TPA: PaaI family thioesterase, partial [Candidatus Limnocylindria bacterium]|nr:PaaI family thioesterase [Candidatus Limnocylindria bacterium]
QNPAGLRLDVEADGDRITARHTVTRAHQSYDGTVHGGIITALLDEVMGWAVFIKGDWGVTARMSVTFRAPVPLGEELVATGWIERDRGRGLETKGELVRAADGTVLAEADALFLRMPEGQRAALERRYGAEPAVLAAVRAAIDEEERQRA